MKRAMSRALKKEILSRCDLALSRTGTARISSTPFPIRWYPLYAEICLDSPSCHHRHRFNSRRLENKTWKTSDDDDGPTAFLTFYITNQPTQSPPSIYRFLVPTFYGQLLRLLHGFFYSKCVISSFLHFFVYIIVLACRRVMKINLIPPMFLLLLRHLLPSQPWCAGAGFSR
jgi:hypothetical protein